VIPHRSKYKHCPCKLKLTLNNKLNCPIMTTTSVEYTVYNFYYTKHNTHWVYQYLLVHKNTTDTEYIGTYLLCTKLPTVTQCEQMHNGFLILQTGTIIHIQTGMQTYAHSHMYINIHVASHTHT